MHKTIPSHSRNPLIQRLIERNPGMAIGNSVPIDLSLLEDIEQSANQLSSQLDALLAGLRSQLQQVALQEPLSLSLTSTPLNSRLVFEQLFNKVHAKPLLPNSRLQTRL